MNEEYTFDLDKLTVGDYIFLASLRENMPLDEEFARRAFEMLGRVLIDADLIPADQLPNVIDQFNDALLTRAKTKPDFSNFLDSLERGEDNTPDAS